MYELTNDPDMILNTETGFRIPRGHWMWDAYQLWLAAGNSPAPLVEPSNETLIEQTRGMMTLILDQTVQARGYDDIVSCISYVGDPNPRFDTEARAARAWRSAVYTLGYQILADTPVDVTRPEHVIALLPNIEWPE